MLDKYNRKINYLRISVTDKCNLRCIYCMPEEGIVLKRHEDILSYEQIEIIVKEAVKLGISKLRLTGGEPLIRKNIETLIKKLNEIDGITEIGLTTNGILLAQKVKILKNNGLDRINISLDTLDKEEYMKITRGGDISKVFNGITAALNENFPLKINMVVLEKNKGKINKMTEFCNKNGIKLQLINHFSLQSEKNDNHFFDRPPICSSCNRIRLLADGKLKPCLHSNIEYIIDFDNILESIKKTINSKPECGHNCSNKEMFQIGG